MRRSVPGRRFTRGFRQSSSRDGFLSPAMALARFRAMACSILPAILLILALPGQARAQSAAQLSGTVVDPQGAAVSGAAVRLTNLLTGFERQTATRPDGSFQLLNVPFQTYELQVSRSGFATHTQAVQLRSNVPVLVPVRLALATRKEAIEISLVERITLIDTEATGTRTELNRTAIEQMPVQAGARGLEGLLLNFPGFAANANGTVHPRGAHNQMTYVIDGMPISDQFSGSFATSIDPSMVQSLELYTGDIPPDYGSKVSGVANITTHSGFDGGGDPFGMLELGAGQFDTGSAILQLGGAGEKAAYFGSASAVKSNRFLDSPSLDNLHNGGNAERGFLRLDYHATPKDSLRVSLLAGRSSFQLANLRSQHLNGQQQRRHLRDAAVSLGWVRLISPSTTFDSTTSYRATVAQLFPSPGDTPVTASLARRLSTFSTFNRFNLLRGRHHWKIGFDTQVFPVSENFFFGITDRRFNPPGSRGLQPQPGSLRPHPRGALVPVLRQGGRPTAHGLSAGPHQAGPVPGQPGRALRSLPFPDGRIPAPTPAGRGLPPQRDRNGATGFLQSQLPDAAQRKSAALQLGGGRAPGAAGREARPQRRGDPDRPPAPERLRGGAAAEAGRPGQPERRLFPQGFPRSAGQRQLPQYGNHLPHFAGPLQRQRLRDPAHPS